MSWECPECGERNHDESSILCPCGFVDDGQEELRVPDSLLADGDSSASRGQTERISTPSSGGKEEGGFVAGLFDWQTWRYAYVRWVVCFIVLLTAYRRTMDGMIILSLLQNRKGSNLRNNTLK